MKVSKFAGLIFTGLIFTGLMVAGTQLGRAGTQLGFDGLTTGLAVGLQGGFVRGGCGVRFGARLGGNGMVVAGQALTV